MVDYDCEFEPDLGICDCICDSIVPTDALLLLFTSKVDFDWVGPGTFCANVFNVYRQDSQYLPDIFPPVAVADDYGFCLYSGLLVSHAMDLMVPPTSVVQHYLVTAESPAGESLMGFASLPFPRPNTSPCPSPPPLP